jgi:hypothetical protein
MKKILLLLLIGLMFSCNSSELTPDDIGDIYLFNNDTVKLEGYTIDSNYQCIVHLYKISNGVMDSTLIQDKKIVFESVAILIKEKE